jgi:hypothetical protein
MRLAERVARDAAQVPALHIRGGDPLASDGPEWADLLASVDLCVEREATDLLVHVTVAAWRQVSRQGGFHPLAVRAARRLDALEEGSTAWFVLTRIVAACATPRAELSLASVALSRLLSSARVRAVPTMHALALCDASLLRRLVGDGRGAIQLAEHASSTADTALTKAWALLRVAEAVWEFASEVPSQLDACAAGFEQAGDRSGMARVALLRAQVELSRGNASEASHRAQAAGQLARVDGDHRVEGQAQALHGATLVALGDGAGLARMHTGLRVIEDTGDRVAANALLPLLVRSYIQSGQPERARLALRCAQRVELPKGLTGEHPVLAAEVALELDGPAAAQVLAQDALTQLRPEQPRRLADRLHLVLSRCLEVGAAP